MDGLIPLQSSWFSLLTIPVGFTVAAALTPVVIIVARRFDWVAEPTDDRWHRDTTALMGGIAIYIGVAVAVYLFTGLRIGLAFAASSTLMFISGLVDDRFTMRPVFKVILQLGAAIIFVSFGHMFEVGVSRWFTIPLTIFWLLGITNGINLIDNMDGLAGGVCAITAVALGVMALIAGAPVLAVAVFAIAGSVGGFLIFNFKPAHIFMGDCGSLFLGFSLAALSVLIQGALPIRGLMAVCMTAIILGVPILDTILVTVERSLNGRSISQGGRDHASHRLVALGLSERKAVVLLYLVSGVFGLLSVVFYLSDIRLRVSLFIFIVLGAGIFGTIVAKEKVYNKTTDVENKTTVPVLARLFHLPRALFGPRWKPVFAVLVDASVLAAAFVLAHYLRFEDGLTPLREVFLLKSLPLVILLPLPIFAVFRFYQAIWRYAGALGIMRIIGAVTLATITVYGGLVLFHGYSAVSRGVMVIFWMTVVLGLIATRFGFRGMRSYLIALNRRGKPVAIYGSGQDGDFVLRYLRCYEKELGMCPIVIIDDNKTEWGHQLQGLPVIGGVDQIHVLKEKYKVTELILPNNHLDNIILRSLAESCKEAGISCRELSIYLDAQKVIK
jgi:UDP-GlcNAc:undecaprenyl-phosphate GlcNAc-1-phosphate transferase